MPDPNTEHGLRVQLATALKERDEQKARADAAVARSNDLAGFLDEVHALNRSLIQARDAAQEALAAARRETALYRGVIDNLLSVMEMQEKRESGAFHITGEVMFGIWSDAKSGAREALAAPAAAAGEEAK